MIVRACSEVPFTYMPTVLMVQRSDIGILHAQHRASGWRCTYLIAELPPHSEVYGSKGRRENLRTGRHTPSSCTWRTSSNPGNVQYGLAKNTLLKSNLLCHPPRLISSAGPTSICIISVRNVTSEVKKRNIGKIFHLAGAEVRGCDLRGGRLPAQEHTSTASGRGTDFPMGISGCNSSTRGGSSVAQAWFF